MAKREKTELVAWACPVKLEATSTVATLDPALDALQMKPLLYARTKAVFGLLRILHKPSKAYYFLEIAICRLGWRPLLVGWRPSLLGFDEIANMPSTVADWKCA